MINNYFCDAPRDCGCTIWDCGKVNPVCADIDCLHYKAPQPPTNGDRIRSMSDEELACFLSEMADTCERNTECNQHCYGCDEMFCELDNCLKWLTQPTKEE